MEHQITKPIFKEFFYIFYHSLLSSLFGLAGILIGTYLVSKIGTDELAGVGLNSSFYVLAAVLIGSASGSALIFISKAFGGKKPERLKIIILIGTILTTLTGFVLFLFLFFVSPLLFSLFNASPIVMKHLSDYYYIWMFSALLFPFNYIYTGILNTVKMNIYTTIILIVSIILNVPLDYFLIFGIEGWILPMGVKGAALGGLLTNAISVILLWYVLHSKGWLIYSIKNKPKAIAIFNKILHRFKHFVVGGIAIPASYLSIQAGASYFSTNTLASWIIIDKMFMVYSFFTIAMGSATATLITRYHGAKTRLKGYTVFLFAFKLELVWYFFLYLIIQLFGDKIGSIYLNNPESIEMFKYGWVVIITYYLLWGIQGRVNSAIMSVGNPIHATKASLARNIGLAILPYICARYFGFEAFVFAHVFVVAVVLIWVRHLYYKYLKPYFLDTSI